ncbi:MAG TPA: hypothetical protein VLA89_07190 [Gemmatimonadales bacterium]|nr:hypothetical protein [Gemmatimonadales bacterium]
MAEDPAKTKARDVSWWAETADGCSDEENLVIVRTKNGVAEIRKEREVTENDERLVLIERNPGVQPKQKLNIGVVLEGEWYKLPEIDEASCDAFFVTKSAARKFVYPYYEAHRLLTPKQMEKLKAPWGPDVLGIGHYPPSRSLKMQKPGQKQEQEEEEGHYETAFVVRRAHAMEQPFFLEPLSKYVLSLAEPGGEKGSK